MKKKKQRRALKVTVTLSVLVAISIVCGKCLAISAGDFMRFSFENLPIIVAGVLFGPVAGAFVGVIADLIGCILVGYTINPIITLGAAMIGCVSGLIWMLLKSDKVPYWVRLTLTVLIAHLVGSVLIKSFGLKFFPSSFYYNNPISLWALMLWRFLNYVIVGGVEGVLLFFLMKNKMITSQFRRGDNT